MAPHSSTLAWEIPWAEEPGRLQSMGSLRLRHDWATSLSLFTFMHCRRKWQLTPIFLHREFQGQRSLVGCLLWGRTELDTTDVTQQQPGVSWLPTFAFQSPIMKRTSFWGVRSKGLVSLYRTIQLQFLQCYWLGPRLGLLWYWMVCLGNKQR